MKWLFAIIYLLITFFGLGPVLFADGSSSERMMTLVVVLILYAITTAGLRYVLRRK